MQQYTRHDQFVMIEGFINQPHFRRLGGKKMQKVGSENT
jgi:hypothetical protein